MKLISRSCACLVSFLLFIGVFAGCTQSPAPKSQDVSAPPTTPVEAATPVAAVETPVAEKTAVAVDEFGVPTGDTPPTIPPGFASTEEVYAAIAASKVKLIDQENPAPESIGVVVRKGVEYGRIGDRPLLLDLYVSKDLKEPAPGLVFIHGGGWSGGDRNDYRFYCTRFARRGYVVATVGYRLSGEALFPAAVQDTKCAVRWLRANAAANMMDPDRIAVMGGSAGGYLAMMIGYSSDVPEFEGDGGNPGVSSRVNVVIDAYGPTDLTAPIAQVAPQVTSFLGKSYADDPDLFRKASPITYLTPDDPPTLIFQGTVDDTVPAAQSDLLAAKCKEIGVACEYVKFEGWPHTLDLADEPNKCCQWHMLDFFKKHLVKK